MWQRYKLQRLDPQTNPQTNPAVDFDESGEVWSTVATIIAQKVPLRGAELIAARQVNEQLESKLRFRWNSELDSLSSEDRFERAGKVLDIKGVVNVDDANRWIECPVIEHG